jgi:TPR repeat protein
LKKIFLSILIAWGAININHAQAVLPKQKTSLSQKRPSPNQLKKVVAKKQFSKAKSSKKSNVPQKLPSQNFEGESAILKAKELFKSNFIIQAFRLLNQYKNAPEMDAEAFYDLAICLRSIGVGVETNYQLSEQYLQKSLVLKPSKEIYLNLGQLYELGGFGLKRDVTKALSYFQQASDLDVPFAKFELGRLYFQGLEDSLKNEKKGILLLEEAGNQDVAEAQWMLGSMYAKGYENLPRDMTKAKFWFRKYKGNKTIKPELKL